MNPQQPGPNGHVPPHLGHQPGVPLLRDELVEIGFVAVEEEQYVPPDPITVISPTPTPPPAPVPAPPPTRSATSPIASPTPTPPAPKPAASPAPPAVPTPPAPRPPVPTPTAVVSENAAAKPSPKTAPSTVEPMAYSANTQNLRTIGRLHVINILLYVLIFAFAAGIIAGGWYLYTTLGQAG